MGTCAQPVVAKNSHNPLINLRIVYGRQCVWGTCKEILDGAVNFLKDISYCLTLGYAIPHLAPPQPRSATPQPRSATPQPRSATPHHNYLHHNLVQLRHTTLGYATPRELGPYSDMSNRPEGNFPGSERTFFLHRLYCIITGSKKFLITGKNKLSL